MGFDFGDLLTGLVGKALGGPVGMAGGLLGKLLLGNKGNSSGPVAAPPAAPNTNQYSDLLQKLLSSIDYDYGQQKTEADKQLEANMLHRGILGSGIHTEDLGNINAKIERARAAAANAAALGVYSASQQDKAMQNQMYQWDVGRADQQSAMNQQKRSNIMGLLGSLAGAYAGGGMARPQMDLGYNVGADTPISGGRTSTYSGGSSASGGGSNFASGWSGMATDYETANWLDKLLSGG